MRKNLWRDERWHWDDTGVYSDQSHGGFYTQDEIREIVAYATKKHITIVPEIDMPGHAMAAIAAYPWLVSTGERIKVPSPLVASVYFLYCNEFFVWKNRIKKHKS